MEKRPTKKQKELLNFIDGFIKGNGYGPSYREIMRSLDYKSVSTVATHVDGLIQRGWLRKRDNEARTLEVVAPGEESTPTVVVGAISGVEKELRAKLAELEKSPEENAEDITTLSRTLVILGYEPKTEIA
ncbi:MAG TPA: hypothetical protein VLH14_02000 [Patescibacteria group bacterium]|nr:hypothetical protein [Patescibacteria group bacterium]